MNFDTLLALLIAFNLGLTAFVGKYIWTPPQALFFLCIVYFLQFITELFLMRKQDTLNRQNALKKFIEMSTHVAGAIIMLFVAKGLATYSLLFVYWLPTGVYAMLSAALLIGLAKVLSKLNWIPEIISIWLEKEITKKKLFENYEKPAE